MRHPAELASRMIKHHFTYLNSIGGNERWTETALATVFNGHSSCVNSCENVIFQTVARGKSLTVQRPAMSEDQQA
jgi:hypothetical protein